MASKVIKRRRRKTSNTRSKDAIKRTFGDLEVRDAVKDMRIPPLLPQDLRGANKKDPHNCALARACARGFGSTAALFFRRRAYVDVIGDDGIRRVERFTIPPAAQSLIASFDKGEGVPEDGRQMTLEAPRPSEKLDYQLDQYYRRRKAIAKGEITPSKRGPQPSRKNPRDFEVRDGRGQWQMVNKKGAVA